MATITQRSTGLYQVKIRKQGFPSLSKTFKIKKDAEAWARMTESGMERGLWRDTTQAETTSLASALERYQKEVSVHKRSARTEGTTIRAWLETSIAEISLARIGGADIAKI